MRRFFARFLGSRGVSDIPDGWRAALPEVMPYYALLTGEEQAILCQRTMTICGEKYFEGCRGFEVDDSARICVAAHAALLVMRLDPESYPGLKSILLYPDSFVAPREVQDEVGMVSEFEDELVGESWDLGAVIFSWREILEDTQLLGPRNVLLHEFAHQLDPQDDASPGWPGHLGHDDEERICEVLEEEYERFNRAIARGSRTVIEEYGAEDPAEFFAVVSEMFFLRPRRLKQHHPRLYEAFRLFYRQDPIVRFRRE